MSNPLVSIIIPAYNSEKYISETLNSVLSQVYRPIEIIVVDDGSTDGTAEVVKNYQTNLTVTNIKANKLTETPNGNIREINKIGIDLIYIYEKNSGPSRARNSGIKIAKGEFITFLDADDLWTKTKLETQMNYMRANPEISLVFGDMMVFNEQGTLVDSAFRKYGYPECDKKGKVLNAFESLLIRNYVSTGTVLLRRNCFKITGYFDENIKHAEDYDLWLRVTLNFEVGCISEVFRLKRIHNFNLAKEEEDFYKSNIYILRKIRKDYSSIIIDRKIDINDYLLKAIKKLSYFYYIKKEYIKALRTLASTPALMF